MIGRTISHYEILSKLGEGGMGEVWEARDSRLDRVVAIKLIPKHLSANPDTRTRFAHEAKAASSIEHANICTIHEIDETPEGETFIVMPRYQGELLSERIAIGRLPIEESLRIVEELAGALAEAHDHGIIHRDVKPANIIIDPNGRPILLDFGLAKLSEHTKVTRTGTTVGTLAYMAPEQAAGGGIDGRADLFSLGVVLYELVTGVRPFRGDHDAAILYSIAHETPAPLASHDSNIPAALQTIIDRSLAKNPDDRYKSMHDLKSAMTMLRGELRSVSNERKNGGDRRSRPRWMFPIAAAIILIVTAVYFLQSHYSSTNSKNAEAARTMIAVIPFDNLGPADDEYFADGITEAITARLGGMQGLGVISRQSAIQYKNSDKSLREIGKELGVEYVLEGTVQRERPADPSSSVRVIPQLIRVSDDTHAWVETYNEEISEVFRVQSEIARHVARSLGILLRPQELEALAVKPTENTEAYEFYLRGKNLTNKSVNYDDLLLAEEMYTKAVELDPEFAAAWAVRGRLRLGLYWDHGMKNVLVKAEEDVSRAFELAPSLSDVLMARGYLYYYGYREYDRALEAFLQVEKSQPSNTDALFAAAFICRRKGEWARAADYLEQVLALNPRSAAAAGTLAQVYSTMREFSKAERCIDLQISIDPRSSSAPYEAKAMLYLKMAEPLDRAERVLRDALTRVSPQGWASTISTRLTLIRVMPDIFETVLSSTQNESTPMWKAEGLLFRAELDVRRGKKSSAVARYDSIRVLLEPVVKTDKDNLKAQAFLGMAYSGLDMADEAVDNLTAVSQRQPVSEDAYFGAAWLEELAIVHVRAGQHEAALDRLEFLLSIPSGISVGLLRNDPIWDPLRGNPRFQQLLENQESSRS